MYITEKHFAFYSNVFGFVTKLLIPVESVVVISKEKVAKIFSNAIGVATEEERHVFGSFMKREQAYRLMLSVWRPAEVPDTPTLEVKLQPDVEASECSIGEEESSCSVSGNESPMSQMKELADQSLLMRQRESGGSGAGSLVVGQLMESSSSSAVTSGGDVVDGGVAPAIRQQQSVEAMLRNGVVLRGERLNKLVGGGGGEEQQRGGLGVTFHQTTGGVGGSGARLLNGIEEKKSSVDESKLARLKRKVRQINIKFPTDIHIVYLGVVLAVILALFSGFLLYRIMDIQARASHMERWVSEKEFNWKKERFSCFIFFI